MDVISWQRVVVNPTRSIYALITQQLYGTGNTTSPVKQQHRQSSAKMTGGRNRISFDGTYAPLQKNPVLKASQNLPIRLTHCSDTDWLTLSELAFEWADSYDAKVSSEGLQQATVCSVLKSSYNRIGIVSESFWHLPLVFVYFW